MDLDDKKSWTVILSSGPKSSVKQFQLRKLVFYFSICFVLLQVGSIAGLTYFINEVTTERSKLSVQLEEQIGEVAEIKNEYMDLQQETLSVQRSIAEFKLFEERLSELNLDMPADLDSEKLDGSGGMPLPMQHGELTNTPLELLEIKKELPELIQKFEETLTRLTEYQNELRNIPTIIPASQGRITSRYGNRKDPFNFKKTFHSGIDIAAPLNTEIFAAADGIVSHAGPNGGYGLVVTIDHGNTYETLYAHLNRIDVKVGEKVIKGDVIGGMGTTGRSTGVHLHYELKRNGEHIDPYLYMTFHERNN
jgi:murein DD-endopeptidase MepM/ murein hydrolase activator NlpD